MCIYKWNKTKKNVGSGTWYCPSGIDWAAILFEWQVAGGDELLSCLRSEKRCRCTDVNVTEDDVLIKVYEAAWIKKVMMCMNKSFKINVSIL